jgi:hypothetical protein
MSTVLTFVYSDDCLNINLGQHKTNKRTTEEAFNEFLEHKYTSGLIPRPANSWQEPYRLIGALKGAQEWTGDTLREATHQEAMQFMKEHSCPQ